MGVLHRSHSTVVLSDDWTSGLFTHAIVIRGVDRCL